MSTSYQKGFAAGRQSVIDRLLAAVCDVEGIATQQQLAKVFGVKSQAAVNHWKNGATAPTKKNLIRLLQRRARLRITPIAQFQPVNPTKKGAGWLVDADNAVGGKRETWKNKLTGKKGIFVFYDSRGSVTYIGQTTKQDFFKEIEQRLRDAKLRGTLFQAGLKKCSEHKNPLCQGEVTRLLSVYQVHDAGSIHNIEALMICALMNNHFNRSTEKFK